MGMIKLRLIILFYKSYVLASTIISIICMKIISSHGLGTFMFVFWFKIATLGAIVYFINSYKHGEFYYYKNLGVSKLLLWCSTLFIDISIFVLLLILMLSDK